MQTEMSGFSAELIDYLEGRITFEEFNRRREEREAAVSGPGSSSAHVTGLSTCKHDKLNDILRWSLSTSNQVSSVSGKTAKKRMFSPVPLLKALGPQVPIESHSVFFCLSYPLMDFLQSPQEHRKGV